MRSLTALPIPILVLLAAVAVFATGCSQEKQHSPPGLDVARPAKIVSVGSPGSKARRYPGRVQAAHRVSLAFRVGGPVTEMLASKGEQVEAGDVLARIDRRDYQVQVKNLEAQLAAARAQSEQAAEEYGRVRGLYEHDNASRSDFDRAKAAVDVSRAQVDAQEQALEAARLALADTELKAPYAGTVADRLVEAHQTVAAGQPILRFQDEEGMEVVIDVPEREVAELTAKEPREILVTFDALSEGREYQAVVKEFATESDSQTRTFPVTLQLVEGPEGELLPGMTASARWVSSNGHGGKGAFIVPLASIVTDETGEAYVWKVDAESQRVVRQSVETGPLAENGLEVHSGLSADDRILAAGVHFVVEGQLVRPMEANGE